MDKNTKSNKPSPKAKTKTKIVRGTKKEAEALYPCRPLYVEG